MEKRAILEKQESLNWIYIQEITVSEQSLFVHLLFALSLKDVEKIMPALVSLLFVVTAKLYNLPFFPVLCKMRELQKPEFISVLAIN